MSGEDEVICRFVLPPGKTETTCSDELVEAFDKCKDHEVNPQWVPSQDVLQLKPSKQDVFIIDPFEGKAFDHLTKFKCTIIGPRCLLSSLEEGQPVSSLPYPMLTAAMRGLIITSTGFEREKKERIKHLVERMGGIYSNAFHDGVTHLVCEIVKSKKYEVAVAKGIPIMTEEWVEEVWKQGLHENIKAGDPRFLRYSCPALKGLTICVSQMSKKDKEMLKRKIEAHGGIYSPILDMEKTAILIVTSTEGDKYSYAKKWNIPCLSADWIFDSIDKRQCLESNPYRIDQMKASTPTKTDLTSVKFDDMSMVSMIQAPAKGKSDAVQVDETVGSQNFTVLTSNTNLDLLLRKLEISRVKRAGLFLDNCCIFLSGFIEEQVIQLSRVLKLAGAEHVTQITPRITHIVMCSRVPKHMDMVKKVHATPYLVSVQWLVESMLINRPAKERDFEFQDNHESLSTTTMRKKIRLEDEVTTLEEPMDQDQHSQYEDDILAQYQKTTSSSGGGARDTTQSANQTANETCTQVTRFLLNKQLALVGFDDESESDLSEWVAEAGGEIVFRDFKGTLDYLVGPIVAVQSDFKAKEVVSRLWLEDCLDQGMLLDVDYYHRPINPCQDKPGEGVVIGISNYVSHERAFIFKLAECLGMVAQEIFAKRDKRGAKRSTHLVCKDASGEKYEAALKWGIPVINKDWLMACYKAKQWLSERSFLIGNSSVVTEGKPDPPKQVDISVEDMTSTPVNNFRLTQETPKIDIEKLKPKAFNLDITPRSTPSKEEDSQRTPQTSSRKRKRDDVDNDTSMDGLQTPETPYGAFLKDDPSPKSRKFWKRQCMEFARHENRAQEEVVTSQKQPDQSMTNQDLIQNVKDGLCQEKSSQKSPNSKSFADLMEEKLQKVGKSWKNISQSKTPDSPVPIFQNCTIYVHKKFAKLQDEINAIVASLGGSFAWTLTDKVTHMVFSGQANDRTKEFRQAKSDGKFIVAPDWVYMSRDESRRLEEEAFPHTFNPKMTLNITVSGTSPETRNDRARKNKPNKTGAPETTVQTQPDETVDQPGDTIDFTADMAKLNQMVNDDKTGSARKRNSATRSKLSIEGPDLDLSVAKLEKQTQVIEWVDPKEEEERKKLKERLSKDTQALQADFAAMGDTLDEVNDRLEAMEDNKENEQVNDGDETVLDEDIPKRVLLSGVSESKRKEFAVLLCKSKTELSTASTCDPEASHVVAEKISRSEKMLGSIASGKCILHPSYLDSCLAVDALLPASRFEWGNPENGFLDDSLTENELNLAKAAYRWHRLVKQGRNKGAFSGIKAIIVSNKKRVQSFAKLLELGGGIVVEADPPFSDPKGATHCLAEPSKVDKSVKFDWKSLAAHGVAVVGPLYINDFLVTDPPVSVEHFLLDEFKPYWKNS